jgi:hypothetical protein
MMYVEKEMLVQGSLSGCVAAYHGALTEEDVMSAKALPTQESGSATFALGVINASHHHH